MPDLPANAPEDWPMRKSLMLIALLLAGCGRQAGDRRHQRSWNEAERTQRRDDQKRHDEPHYYY